MARERQGLRSHPAHLGPPAAGPGPFPRCHIPASVACRREGLSASCICPPALPLFITLFCKRQKASLEKLRECASSKGTSS